MSSKTETKLIKGRLDLHYLRDHFAFISFSLTLAITPLTSAAQDSPILLEYQGTDSFSGVYWEGAGLKITWRPRIYNRYMEYPQDLFSSQEVEYSVSNLNIEVVDPSILTENKDQWVAANRKPSLTQQISESASNFHVGRYRNAIDRSSVDGSADVQPHLFQSKPIPIYVYGIKGTEGTEILRFGQEIYSFYEEYLVRTIYVQIDYSGEPELWFNQRLQFARDEHAEERQEAYFITAGISMGLIFSAIILWVLRYRIAAILFWIKNSLIGILSRLTNLLKFRRGKSPELLELELQIKAALEKGDYDEASRLAELAERVKKIGM